MTIQRLRPWESDMFSAKASVCRSCRPVDRHRRNGGSMYRSFLIALLLLPCAAGAHSPLLPKPQQIRYGPGNFSLNGLSIVLPADAASEDQFAARELSLMLSEHTSTAAPILHEPRVLWP